MNNRTRKSRGFAGERIIELPKDALEKCRSLPLINGLFITRMGLYPRALHHYYHRPTGIAQVILLYCTDGLGWVQLPTHRVTLATGEVLAVAPGVPHAYGADLQNPWTIYWFHLSGTACQQVVDTLADDRTPGQALRVPHADERIALFNRIIETFLGGYSRSNLLAANLAVAYWLASFVRPELVRNAPVTVGPSPTNQAIRYMQQNLSTALTLDNIAQAANLSASFFCRKFKQETGYAPIEYFNHLRIQRACQLLHFSDLRVNEVASQLGMDDPFYFSRLFRKQMGVSPAEYRKREGLRAALSPSRKSGMD